MPGVGPGPGGLMGAMPGFIPPATTNNNQFTLYTHTIIGFIMLQILHIKNTNILLRQEETT